MTGKSRLVQRALLVDILASTSWIFSFAAWITIGALSHAVLRRAGFFSEGVGSYVFGTAIAIVGGIATCLLHNLIVRCFGTRCPQCDKSLSLWSMKTPERTVLVTKKQCPYCNYDLVMGPNKIQQVTSQ